MKFFSQRVRLKIIMVVCVFFSALSQAVQLEQFWYESGYKSGVKYAHYEINNTVKYRQLNELKDYYRFCKNSQMEEYFKAYDQNVFKNFDAGSFFDEPAYSKKILGKAIGFCVELNLFAKAGYIIPYDSLFEPENNDKR